MQLHGNHDKSAIKMIVGLKSLVFLFHGIFKAFYPIQLDGFNPDLLNCSGWQFGAHYGKWYGMSGLAKMLWTMDSTDGIIRTPSGLPRIVFTEKGKEGGEILPVFKCNRYE